MQVEISTDNWGERSGRRDDAQIARTHCSSATNKVILYKHMSKQELPKDGQRQHQFGGIALSSW